MIKFTPTIEQEKAYKDVIKAIKKAKKLGLVFYGKSGALVAYTKQADDYIENNFRESLRGRGGQVDNLHENILADSGADDYGSYLTKEDEEKYS